jgi:hypothetical protein
MTATVIMVRSAPLPLQDDHFCGDDSYMKALVVQEPTADDLIARLKSFGGRIHDGTEWRPLATAFVETLGAAFGMIVEIDSTFGAVVAANDIIGKHGAPPPPPPFPDGKVNKVVLSTVFEGQLIGRLVDTQNMMMVLTDPKGVIAGLITPTNALATLDEIVEVDNWFSWGAVRLDAVSLAKAKRLEVECWVPSDYRFL